MPTPTLKRCKNIWTPVFFCAPELSGLEILLIWSKMFFLPIHHPQVYSRAGKSARSKPCFFLSFTYWFPTNPSKVLPPVFFPLSLSAFFPQWISNALSPLLHTLQQFTCRHEPFFLKFLWADEARFVPSFTTIPFHTTCPRKQRWFHPRFSTCGQFRIVCSSFPWSSFYPRILALRLEPPIVKNSLSPISSGLFTTKRPLTCSRFSPFPPRFFPNAFLESTSPPYAEVASCFWVLCHPEDLHCFWLPF